MTQPRFPSTISTQSRFASFLTIKTVVRKFGKSDGQTGSRCLEKAVLGGGGVPPEGSCITWISITGPKHTFLLVAVQPESSHFVKTLPPLGL